MDGLTSKPSMKLVKSQLENFSMLVRWPVFVNEVEELM